RLMCVCVCLCVSCRICFPGSLISLEWSKLMYNISQAFTYMHVISVMDNIQMWGFLACVCVRVCVCVCLCVVCVCVCAHIQYVTVCIVLVTSEESNMLILWSSLMFND